MTWQARIKPKEGDVRVKNKFLLFPKRIGNTWKWLQKASWVEVFRSFYDIEHGIWYQWTPIQWKEVTKK